MPLAVPDFEVRRIGTVLCNPKRPLKERFRALFTLKNIGGPTSIECIAKAFDDSSALLKHEVAYCLGQLQDPVANEVLMSVLRDNNQESIVRHEAAEALGAIASQASLQILQEYLQDPAREVRETCQLALDRYAFFQDPNSSKVFPNKYGSVDPAPPLDSTSETELRNVLLDVNQSMFQRYRAMFALRNMDTTASVMALCEGFRDDSALFKHEVAFVLGQMQNTVSIEALTKCLFDKDENEMVRHEAAEALGAIATKTVYELLDACINDESRVVRESCEIAIDMCEYENSPEFQYANTMAIEVGK